MTPELGGYPHSSSPCLNRPIYGRWQTQPAGFGLAKNKVVRGELSRPRLEKVFNGFHDKQNHQNDLCSSVMSRSGLARAIRQAHQEREVACGGLNQELFVHVVEAAHVEPVQTTRVELMREVPLDPLAALPLQSLAAFALDASPIVMHRFLLRLFAIPVAWPTIRLGNVRSHSHIGKSHHHIVTVIY